MLDENSSEAPSDQGEQAGIGRDEPNPGESHHEGSGGWGGQFGDIKQDDKVESPPEPENPKQN